MRQLPELSRLPDGIPTDDTGGFEPNEVGHGRANAVYHSNLNFAPRLIRVIQKALMRNLCVAVERILAINH